MEIHITKKARLVFMLVTGEEVVWRWRLYYNRLFSKAAIYPIHYFYFDAIV